VSLAAAVVDSHVHFWDPGALEYPWLSELPSLRRPFGPAEFASAAAGVPLEGVVFVECNCAPEQSLGEVEAVGRLAEEDPRILGIVAFADLAAPEPLGPRLDRLQGQPLVRGIRHNIQGTEPGFCLRPAFVEGVREAGRRGLTFDLCATHDQLADVVELCRLCPETRLVLDHCGKPGIREHLLDPWRARMRELAELPHLWCKLSGLLTEADHAAWAEEELVPYADHVAETFGPERLMYGGDWPVVTLAGTYREWYQFTRRFTGGWSAAERAAFYGGNALRCYDLTDNQQAG
jgi:L-fuconolactonase